MARSIKVDGLVIAFLVEARYVASRTEVSRVLKVYWPVLLFASTAVTAWVYIVMSNLDRMIASVWIVVSVALTVRAARQIRGVGSAGLAVGSAGARG